MKNVKTSRLRYVWCNIATFLMLMLLPVCNIFLPKELKMPKVNDLTHFCPRFKKSEISTYQIPIITIGFFPKEGGNPFRPSKAGGGGKTSLDGNGTASFDWLSQLPCFIVFKKGWVDGRKGLVMIRGGPFLKLDGAEELRGAFAEARLTLVFLPPHFLLELH